MTPKEYKEWLNAQLDYYSKKAKDAGKCGLEDDRNTYMIYCGGILMAYNKFNEVEFEGE